MTTLLDIGHEIRDAYASSMAAGHSAWMSYMGEDMRVFHVPELPGDGSPRPAAGIGDQAGAEVSALDKMNTRINVKTVRQASDDLLILETQFTGTFPNGTDFSYPNVLLYTFSSGKIVRLVEVASEQMWTEMRAALAEFGYKSGDAASADNPASK
jgi:ketosteroid isomerase-like protein